MFCPQCGQQLDETARFCSRCGVAVASAMTSDRPVSADGAAPIASDGTPRQASTSRAGAAALLLIVAATAGMIGVIRWGLTESALRSGQFPDGRPAIVVEVLFLGAILWRLGLLHRWWLLAGMGLVALVLPLSLPAITLAVMAALWASWLLQARRRPNGTQVTVFVIASVGGLLVPWALSTMTSAILGAVFHTHGAPWMAYLAAAVEDGGAVLASLPLVLLWRYAGQPLVVGRCSPHG